MRATERERGCHKRDGVGGRGKAGVAGAMLRYLSSITLSSATKFPHLCSHNYDTIKHTALTHTHTCNHTLKHCPLLQAEDKWGQRSILNVAQCTEKSSKAKLSTNFSNLKIANRIEF